MPELTCDELFIPPRLRLNNRPIKQFLDGEEVLYRWVEPGVQIASKNRLSGASIGRCFTPLYDLSCNRSSFCEHPTDVLYNTQQTSHRNNFGVARASVESLNGRVFTVEEQASAQIVFIKLELKHSPEKCMYPHSEIVVYENEQRLSEELKPKNLRTFLRGELAEIFEMCHFPNPAFQLEEYRKPDDLLKRALKWASKFFKLNPSS